jgi:outer membrane phospholipase A
MLKLNLMIAVLVFLVVVFPPKAFCDESEPELIHLYEYRPIYFIIGHPYTKIELSFKAALIRDVPIYFGYTQLMIWDLLNPEPYFRDINYNPEIFYRGVISRENAQWLDFIAFSHESNGLGSAGEKSWDRTILRYHTLTRIGERARLAEEFEAWVPYELQHNPDLAQYRGTWQITLSLSDFLGPFFEIGDLQLRIYPGGPTHTDPTQGGQELTYRGKAKYRAFLPLLVFQIFHGYAENLLDYKEERLAVRAGIGF